MVYLFQLLRQKGVNLMSVIIVISLVSCHGKLFTRILTNGLRPFSDECDGIKENQAAFPDHIFLVKSLVDIYFAKRKKIYCAFIDNDKAFPSIWRTGLWLELLKMVFEDRWID